MRSINVRCTDQEYILATACREQCCMICCRSKVKYASGAHTSLESRLASSSYLVLDMWKTAHLRHSSTKVCGLRSISSLSCIHPSAL